MSELAGVTEDGRKPDLASGDRIGHDAGPDVVEFEDLRVALLDDHRGTWDRGQLDELDFNLPVVSEDEVGKGLALHRGLQQPVDDESVVAGAERVATLRAGNWGVRGGEQPDPVDNRGRAVVESVNLYATSKDAFTDRHEEVVWIFDARAPGAVTDAELGFTTCRAADVSLHDLRDTYCIEVAAGMLATTNR